MLCLFGISPLGDRAVFAGELWRLPDPVENKFLKFLLVHLDAESGLVWNQGVALLHLDRLLENPLAEREELLSEEIRRAGIKLQAGGQRDRAERAMWGDDDIVDLGHRGNLARFEDASDMRQVGLDD